ncbi:M56 family metallopeptidase [Tsuneonella sp. HG222]
MMTAALLIELALKSALLAGGMLLVLRFARIRSAAQRSWLAHLGLLGLVLLPAATFLLPSWNPLPKDMAIAADEPASLDGPVAFPVLADAPGPDEGATTSAPLEATAAATPSTMPDAGELAVWVYLLPAALLLLTMLIAVVRLGAMHRRAQVLVDSTWLSALAQAQRRMGFKHGTALLVSPELRSPVSWGLMRPIILLSDDTVDATGEAEAIIAHELAHVARLDWAKLLLARLACALFWFNPLVWRLAREAHQLREEAADDAVLLSEVDDAAYASLLVNAARHDNKAMLIAAHGVAPAKDSLKRRITRVLDRDIARGPAGNTWSAICVTALVLVAAPLAAFDPAAKAPGETIFTGSDAVANHLDEKMPGKLIEKTIERAASDAVAALPFVDAGTGPLVIGGDEANHGRASQEIDNLVAYKALDMTPEYIASIRDAGFANADMEQLLEAKAVGVTPEFARTVRGWDRSASLDDVVEAKAIGLTPAYFGEMKSLFRDAGSEDISQLKAVGVTLAFAREMRALFPGADAEAVSEMKAVGVTPEFVREMRRQGMSARDTDDVVEARVMSSHLRGRPGQPVAITRPNGSSVSIAANGATVVARPNGSTIAVSPSGATAMTLPNGTTIASPAPPASLPD